MSMLPVRLLWPFGMSIRPLVTFPKRSRIRLLVGVAASVPAVSVTRSAEPCRATVERTGGRGAQRPPGAGADGGALTVVCSADTLFASDLSGTPDVTLAVSAAVPAEVGVTRITTVALAPLARLPSV